MSKFQGVIVPIVTPFNRDDAQTINYEAGEQLVEKIIAAGADGIFTFGSNGEFFVCTPEEKIAFSKFVIEKVNGRVPVIAGTGGNADPVMLASGIGTALVTTFWGLLIAIPALSAYAAIRNTVDAATLECVRRVERAIARFRPAA